MFNLSENSIKNMKGCDPRLKQVAFKAIEISPFDFGIPEDGGLRTAERQKELYDLGRSKCDGYIFKSRHQPKDGNTCSMAIDFFGYKDGVPSWDRKILAVIACTFLQSAGELGYKLQWGGLWISYQDYPHIQLNDFL